ncbi:MAG: response regulator transcription factor [Burkholderiales bacterium]|nr:response regulator transcription factor [Burkholderiales bacterium]
MTSIATSPIRFDLPRIKVAVDHVDPLVAIGLSTVLGQEPDIDLVTARPAEIVIADYAQGLTLAGQTRIQSREARVRVLVVAGQSREQDVRIALDAGVQGYLELGCRVQELLNGVRQVARGSRYLSAAAASRIAESLGHSHLTQREHEVLQLVARGQSNKAIALALQISIGTVKAHMKGVMGKLGAATRTQAASIAGERGFLARFN